MAVPIPSKNASAIAVSVPTSEGLVLEIRLKGYKPSLSGGEYPEVKQALCVWHPAFEDACWFTYDQLYPAEIGQEVKLIASFRKWRMGMRPDNVHLPISLHASSILGLDLYAGTANKQKQLCIKPNGSYTSLRLSLLQDYRKVTPGSIVTLRNIEFISAHLKAELSSGGDKNKHLASKAEIGMFSVRVIESSHSFVFQNGEDDKITTNIEAAVTTIRSFIVDQYQMYFKRREPLVEKMKDYYSLRYVTAPGVYIPSSGYMVRMTAPDIPGISRDAVHRMFYSALRGRPEIKNDKMWLSVTKAFMSNYGEKPDVFSGDLEEYVSRNESLKDIFKDCLKIAMDMLTLFSTSVPYLVDMEWRGYRVSGHRQRESEDVQEVERFWPATDTVGHDCEDSGVDADFVKRAIEKMNIMTQAMGSILQFTNIEHPIFYMLSQIFSMFKSCVTQMFCSGDDEQTVKDDGIFHYAAYCIPRVYMYHCELRGYTDPGGNWMYTPEPPSGVRKWEENYREYFGGSFILEGTNTTDPAQFKYSRQQKEIREQVSAESYMVRKRMQKAVTETVNILHSEIFAGDSMALSTFYKYAISCFRGDSPIHREKRVFDYAWYDRSRGGRFSYAVRVESLANLDSSVAISPIMAYDEQVFSMVEQIIKTYCKPYVRPDVDPVLDFSLPTELFNIREIDESKVLQPYLNKPLVNDRYSGRAHYLRFHPLHMDMLNPTRRADFVSDIEKLVSDNSLNIISVRYYCDRIANLPLNPQTMKKNLKLQHMIVILFFDTNNLKLDSLSISENLSLIGSSIGQYV